MTQLKKSVAVGTLVIAFSAIFFPAASSGLTVMEEEQLAREYIKIISAQMELVDDPMIVGYINTLGKKLVASFPPQPFTYRFYVVRQEVYNAFAIPGGHIFMYTGLMAAMESEEELAGILSHEISHVYCRHIAKKIEKSKKLNMATLAGVAAGVLLGVAGGGEAAGAVTMGSMAAGQSAALANSRADEIQADQIGLEYLTKAGYNGEGLLVILKKIRSKQWFGADVVPSYLMTHPAVEDRLAYIDTFLDSQNRRKANQPDVSTGLFPLVHARVMALYSNEKVALGNFRGRIERNGEDIGTEIARLLHIFARHRRRVGQYRHWYRIRIDAIGPIRVGDIEEAQRQITAIAEGLFREESGSPEGQGGFAAAA